VSYRVFLRVLCFLSCRAPFIIPELPHGQNMIINIKSTWGDKYYVGLNGIELFADNGEPRQRGTHLYIKGAEI